MSRLREHYFEANHILTLVQGMSSGDSRASIASSVGLATRFTDGRGIDRLAILDDGDDRPAEWPLTQARDWRESLSVHEPQFFRADAIAGLQEDLAVFLESDTKKSAIASLTVEIESSATSVLDHNSEQTSNSSLVLHVRLSLVDVELGRTEDGESWQRLDSPAELPTLLPRSLRALHEATTGTLQAPVCDAPVAELEVFVFEGGAAASLLHNALAHCVEADHLFNPRSTMSPLIGQRVAVPSLSVLDTAQLDCSVVNYSHDCEGTPAATTALIEQGVLTGCLSDRECSERYGVTASGNARRESYAHSPVPRISNLVIPPGSVPYEDIVQGVSSGALVRTLRPGQMDPITGEFVVGVAEAYRIVHGAVRERLPEFSLAGTVPDVLSSVREIGSDSGECTELCWKDRQHVLVGGKSPSIRVDGGLRIARRS